MLRLLMASPLSWLFLLFAALAAASTWNVFRPRWAPRVAAGLSFFVGWLTAEMALHHVAFQLVVAAIFVALGAAGGVTGQIALGLIGASCLGLLASHLGAGRSREAVLASLREGMGPDYAEEVLPALAPLPSLPLTMAQRLYPFRIHTPGVRVLRDRVYHEPGKFPLRLDIYDAPSVPPPGGAGTPRPMLLYIHGGAWVIGDKERQGLPLLNHLASRGWLCATAAYRLSPRATFPDHIVDVKRAITWLKSHAAELGGDPDFLVISGGSAGGHLAALAALTANDPAWQPGFESADTSLQGCVGIYGVYDFKNRDGHNRHDGLQRILEKHVMKSRITEAPEAWERASPMARVHAGAPPFLLVHGTHDTLVPIASARRFAELLRDAGVSPVVLAEFRGAQHAFEVFPSVRAAIGVDAIDRFCSFVYSVHLRSCRALPPPPRAAA